MILIHLNISKIRTRIKFHVFYYFSFSKMSIVSFGLMINILRIQLKKLNREVTNKHFDDILVFPYKQMWYMYSSGVPNRTKA